MLLRESGTDSELLSQLKDAASALDGAFAGRAGAFVETGNELVKAVSIFRDLTSVFESLPTALSNEDLTKGSAALEEVARDCATIHDLIPNQVRAMEALASANDNIGTRLTLMRDSINFVASIAINARIEASALKRNSQDMLTFTYDVAKLAATAEVTIDQYSAEQRTAHEVLHAARSVLTRFATNHRAQLGSVSEELRRNLQSVEGRRTTALSEAAQIGERSRQITASIGTLITALQIADITSQRLAHVHESVGLLIKGLAADGYGEDGEWWSGLCAEERTAVAAQVSSLQIAQIDNALADLRTETQSIWNEMSKLIRDAAAMGEQGAALYGGGGDAAHSFLGELAGRINLAGRLLSDCQNACGVVSELNESVGSKFGTLHEQAASFHGIVGIVGSVRLIGLNAHLKSDSLGQEGRTLSAISRELRNSADFIADHARDLIKTMDQTVVLFEELKTHNSAVGSDRLTTLNWQMTGALAAFQESGVQLASAIARLSSEGDKVCAILHAALDRMIARCDLESRLDAARDALRSIAGCDLGAGPSGLAKERATSFFGRRYTMASERNVHDAQGTSAKAGDKFRPPAAAETAVDDLESILF